MADTPRDIAELMRQRLFQADMAGFADLFAADAVFEYPFEHPAWPPVIHGRDAIRDHLVETRRYLTSLIEITAFDTVVHETADPEVLVLEQEAAGITKATGRPFRFASGIGVLTVRDGEAVRYRDYTNPLGSAAATGLLPELLAGLAAQAAG
jgi:ketosteroid isomerase-like protein